MATNPNILQERHAFIIGDTYAFFPELDMQFDNTVKSDGINYGVYTNLTGRTSIQIKFDADNLPPEP